MLRSTLATLAPSELGEFRISLSEASQVLGYSPNWLGRILGRSGSAVKALRSIGFTEKVAEVVAQPIQGNHIPYG